MTTSTYVGTWTGEGLRRELFFFPWDGVELCASFYAAREPSRPATLICPAWGIEASYTRDLAHRIALGFARMGGGALIFDQPGHGDSGGEVTEATFGRLTQAAATALEEGRSRFVGTWGVTGVRLGCAVASVIAADLDLEPLVLIQPALDPGAHFDEVLKRSRRGSLENANAQGLAFGVPISAVVHEAGAQAAPGVRRCLDAFRGRGAVISYERTPVTDTLSPRLERVVVRGKWKGHARAHPAIEDATLSWLRGTEAA